MRASIILLGTLTLVGAGCTIYVAAELSGQTSSTTTLGGCFNLANNPCGQCIATACEKPSAMPPVSLKQVCSLASESNTTFDVTNCASDPRLANSYCQDSYIDGGAYAPAIDTQGAAENNVRKCVFDNCFASCSACGISVTSCGSTVTLVEAGTCGKCLDQAMNAAGSSCQEWVFQGGCDEYASSPVAQCAASTDQCATRDCSGLSAPSTNLIDAGYALYTCLWSACQGSCQ